VASVELKGLGKRYGDAVAVEDVSLRIGHGQLVCLLGPSGCGKTTTLRLIAGFIEPSAGEIVVGGKVLSSPARTVPPEGRNMSMIFQSYALWPHMTVAENVAYGLKIRKLDKVAIDAKLKAILSTTRLDALAERYPGELSGGQQQRVSLARALVVEPETLLLDEPLSNLDANLREEMRFEIRRLHDRYRYTTVYVTHDQAEAMTTADLIAVMNHGRIEQLGTPQQIYDHPHSAFVARFIGGSNILVGKAIDSSRIALASATLATTGRALVAGEPTSVSIRQHEIEIMPQKPADAANVLAAVVGRQVFLGSARDYTVVLTDKTELRVTAPANQDVAPGEEIWLRLPALRCRALMGGGDA
jgi:iron(III) transport system ATP-binding protein